MQESARTPMFSFSSLNKFSLLSLSMIIALVTLPGCFDTVDSLVKKGCASYEAKDYAEAKQHLSLALMKDPSDKEALIWMGQTFRREGQYDSALFYLKRADILYPKDRALNEILFEVAFSMQDWMVAIGATLVMIGTGDPQEQHYARLSELWDREEHPYNAYFWLKKLMGVTEPTKQMYLTAARLSALCDSPAHALFYIDTAVQKFGDDTELKTSRGAYLSQSSRHAEAENIFRELIASDSLNPLNYLNLAHGLSEQNSRQKLNEALSIYRKIQNRISARYGVDSLIGVIESTLTTKK